MKTKFAITKQGVRCLNSLASKKKPKLEMPPEAAFVGPEMSDYDIVCEMIREQRG